MKKNLLAVMAVVMGMASCTNENLMEVAEPGYGYIAVNVSNDPVVTRATVTQEQLANWTIVVTNGESINCFSGAANELSSRAFAAGNYTLMAYNYQNDADAHEVNDGWGDARYAGTVTPVVVVAGGTATPTIACGTAKNARISVVFNESFTTAVQEGYSLVTNYDTRTHTFPPTNGDKKAYYPADVDVNYTLSYTYKGEARTATGTIRTVAGTEHQLNVKMNTNGTISVSITYDDFTTSGSDITIDAAGGGVVQ